MSRSDRPQRAAQLLLNLRRPGPRPPTLPDELAPRSEQEAYEVQRELTRARGTPVGGWKVAMSGPGEGTSAPIFADELYSSPAAVECVIGERLGLEPEVAFTLRRDLPTLAEGVSYTRDELIEAIDAAYAAIEIVVSRYRSHDGATPLARLADNISNGGLVLSAPCRNWRSLELTTVPLRLTVHSPDGKHVEHASQGGHPLGDPLAPLLWLVNDRAQHRGGIRAGEAITTGSYAGLRYAKRGARVVVEFAGLGTATLQVR
jgi:2-keto-4-pentenoate hydratase